jgi:hypothetical protein
MQGERESKQMELFMYRINEVIVKIEELIIRDHGYTDEYFKPPNNLQQQPYSNRQKQGAKNKENKFVSP